MGSIFRPLLRDEEAQMEIQRVRGIHASKDFKNMRMQETLANKRALSKMTSALMVRENQNINMLRRVGPSNVKQRPVGAAFFHRNNLLEMPLRRHNVLNFPYVHKRIKPGPIRAKIFQKPNMMRVNSEVKLQNVINDPTKKIQRAL